MEQIHITYPDGKRKTAPLDGDRWIIGRDAGCELALDDSVTSRRHAQLTKDENGAFWIQDLGSKNGTLINDDAITALRRVRPGDRIGIGGCELTLDLPAASESALSIVVSDVASATTGATNAWSRQQRFQIAQRRLELLYELNERLTGRFDRDNLLNELLTICMESLRFERAGIAVWAGEPNPLQWIDIRQQTKTADAEIRLSRSIVDRALRNGERILITDTAQGGFDPTVSMVAGHIRSAMCVPMEYHDTVRGVIYGDRVTTAGAYNEEDIDFFAALGRLGAMGLANVQLVEEMQQRRKIEMQLQWAREIQSQLLPAEPLERPGIHIAALNDPGQRVSGDYYDYFLRPDGQIVLVLADVAGKGPAAALLMANLQAAVHVLLMDERDLTTAVDRLNRLVCRNIADSRFITGIFGLLDLPAKTFSYVNAGHPGLYLIGPGRLEQAAAPGSLPLGVEADEKYTVETISLAVRPTTLFFYSDGAPDAENPAGERFDDKRLHDALAAGGDESPGDLVSRIRRAIKQFARNCPPTDDITLLAARLTEPA